MQGHVNFDFSKLDEAVVIRAYTHEWSEWYNDEVCILRQNLPENLLFEHIGSTSVVGLVSKPIVDIMVGVETLGIEEETFGKSLKLIGYEYFGRLHADTPRLFARKRGDRCYNLQIVPVNSQEWHDKIAFRNYLQNNSRAVEKYSLAKIDAIKDGCVTLLKYHAHKDRLVVELLSEARIFHTKK